MVQSDNLKPKMILFVEDESLSRRAFAQILRSKGYQVAEAQNGVEALEVLNTGSSTGSAWSQSDPPDSRQMAEHANNSYLRIPFRRARKSYFGGLRRVYSEAR